MKQIKFFLALALIISLSSCEKDKDDKKEPQNYEEITYDDIVAKEGAMTHDIIPVINSNGHVLEEGDVIIYKTSSGNYGKMKIVRIDDDYDDKIILEITTYHGDNNDYNYAAYLMIHKNHNCDLDMLAEDMYDFDFKYNWPNSTDAEILPIGPSKYAIYNFPNR